MKPQGKNTQKDRDTLLIATVQLLEDAQLFNKEQEDWDIQLWDVLDPLLTEEKDDENQLFKMIKQLEEAGLLKKDLLNGWDNWDPLPFTILDSLEKKGYFAEKDWGDWDNESVVLEKVAKNGLSLRYASPRWRENSKVITTALKQNGLAIRYAGDLYAFTESYALKAIQQNGFAIAHVGYRFSNDPDFVIKAIQQNGFAIAHVGREFKNNPDFVHLAIERLFKLLEDYKIENYKKTKKLYRFIKDEKNWPQLGRLLSQHSVLKQPIRKNEDIQEVDLKQQNHTQLAKEESLAKLLKTKSVQTWLKEHYIASKTDIEFIVACISHDLYLVDKIPDKTDKKNCCFLQTEPLDCIYIDRKGHTEHITFTENVLEELTERGREIRHKLESNLKKEIKLKPDLIATTPLQNLLSTKEDKLLLNVLWDIIIENQKPTHAKQHTNKRN